MLGAVTPQGVPQAYPIAINTPLDRAYLRPLQEPLYDTEGYNFASVPTSLTFFQRPISQADTSGGIAAKDYSETNLNQACMLDYPKEFSILGFTVNIDSRIGLYAIARLYHRVYLEFTFSGRRPYLRIPLSRIPAGQGLEGAVASTIPEATAHSGVVSCFKNGMGHVANYYRFNLGRSALKIKPGEAFNIKLTWPSTTGLSGIYFATLNDVYGFTAADPAYWYITASLVGLAWMPL